jgi:hypothetical protein
MPTCHADCDHDRGTGRASPRPQSRLHTSKPGGGPRPTLRLAQQLSLPLALTGLAARTSHELVEPFSWIGAGLTLSGK